MEPAMKPKSQDVQDGNVLVLARVCFRKIYGFLICATAFALSIGLLTCTKYIYLTYKFRYPIWLTATHMAMSYLLASASIHLFGLVPERRVLTFREQVSVVVPFSLLGASSIACGNAALMFLYPSFHEMLQNLTPLWTVLCSVAFKGIRYNNATYLSMVPVTCGGMLCAIGEPSKIATLGLVASLSAGALRAVRAIVQGNLLRGQQPIDSLTLLYYATPFNLAMFVLGSACLEGAAPWQQVASVPLRGQLFIVLVAVLAALYNLLAFLMVSHLGPVLAMVVGNLKTPSVIILSMMVFGNPCTALQALGFVVSFVGTWGYNKYSMEILVDDRKPKDDVEEGSRVGKSLEHVPEDEEEEGLMDEMEK